MVLLNPSSNAQVAERGTTIGELVVVKTDMTIRVGCVKSREWVMVRMPSRETKVVGKGARITTTGLWSSWSLLLRQKGVRRDRIDIALYWHRWHSSLLWCKRRLLSMWWKRRQLELFNLQAVPGPVLYWNGWHRFCVDYRVLNSMTKADTFPLHRIEDLLDQLEESNFYSTLDLASSYWHICLTPSRRWLLSHYRGSTSFMWCLLGSQMLLLCSGNSWREN